MANLFGINIRTGCFCNAGSCQRHLNLSNELLREMYKAGHKCSDEIDLLFDRPTGGIRVSFGYYNTYNDVDKLLFMICKCFVKTKCKIPKRTTIKYKNIEQRENLTINNNHNHSQIAKVETDHIDLINISQLSQTDNNIILDEIAIYPIKSCGAFKINSKWKIGNKGFIYDREWMIVKDNGVCLTQKHNTRMCMICPEIDLKNNLLTLNFKGNLYNFSENTIDFKCK